MYAPYPENMMESIKKVEATRAERMATEPRRLTADEKDALLKEFHPDYNPDAFAEIKVGPNKGQKAPLELAEMLHSTSRLIHEKIDLTKIDYDVDVLVIGGGGARFFLVPLKHITQARRYDRNQTQNRRCQYNDGRRRNPGSRQGE